METILPVIIITLLSATIIIQVVRIFRKVSVDLGPVEQALLNVERSYERVDRAVREEISRNRGELSNTLKGFNDSLVSNMAQMASSQKLNLDVFSDRLDKLTQSNEQKLETMRDTVEKKLTAMQEDSSKKLDMLKTAVEERLKSIQEDNSKQLDQMRATVDEKLQGTLEKRLGESFKQVSERLEQVHKGLGEMQTLANGVGDLKKVLTNIKTRGTWGEVQLGALLEQVLAADQYEKNVSTRDTAERVEFAIKLPGKNEDHNDVVWLPIDAKFPVEDYQRLIDAQENADAVASEAAAKQLELRIKQCANDICKKYLNPPRTTDFGILFLPTEGLFAEVIRRNGLAEYVQRECRVMIAGPTTLWSLLNSLQMGFRTLAIQKRSSEVWNLLSAVKTEWAKYGDVLKAVKEKLESASKQIEKAETRTRVIGKKLKDVQELPVAEANSVLMIQDTQPDVEIRDSEM
ncbi:MAG: DNA recombination protein RmuC [Desulfomonilaceae bacterium]